MLVARIQEYVPNSESSYDSAMIQMLDFCCELDLLPMVRGMVECNFPSKQMWKRIVWEKALYIEKGHWNDLVADSQYLDLVSLVKEQKCYSVWGHLADREQRYMRRCETIVKLLSHASLLKADDCRLRKATFSI